MFQLYKKIRRRIHSYFPQRLPFIIPGEKGGTLRAVHISAFSNGNAGDTLLPVVLRDLFHQFLGVKKWRGQQVYKIVSKRDVRIMNSRDFVVIGGGGLFLCDTNPNQLSGWQWSCSLDRLKEIESPIIAFAIGYNRFRGQKDFAPIFTEHLNLFVEKAAFVGIRNHGSIEALKNYLRSDELKAKLIYQPCMTTLIAKIYPSFTDYSKKEDFVAFNCAFDRQQLRSADDSYLYSIARVALELSRFTKVKYYSHMESDLQALPYFDKLGVSYELVRMTDVKKMIIDYSRPRLVIGMRGHAQMIPFGCHTPILSIISHDKMQWFLDDIRHPEWGADVTSNDFEKQLLEKSVDYYSNSQKHYEEIIVEQERLWNITMENMKTINKKVKFTPPQSASISD